MEKMASFYMSTCETFIILCYFKNKEVDKNNKYLSAI